MEAVGQKCFVTKVYTCYIVLRLSLNPNELLGISFVPPRRTQFWELLPLQSLPFLNVLSLVLSCTIFYILFSLFLLLPSRSIFCFWLNWIYIFCHILFLYFIISNILYNIHNLYISSYYRLPTLLLLLLHCRLVSVPRPPPSSSSKFRKALSVGILNFWIKIYSDITL